MKLDVYAMNKGRSSGVRPPTRTLAEFAREKGCPITVLGKAVAKQGLKPNIGKSYDLSALRAIIL